MNVARVNELNEAFVGVTRGIITQRDKLTGAREEFIRKLVDFVEDEVNRALVIHLQVEHKHGEQEERKNKRTDHQVVEARSSSKGKSS